MAAVLMLVVLLGAANWKTLVVLVVAIPLMYFANTRLFSPLANNFVRAYLPKLLTHYKVFLRFMLHRTYDSGESVLARRVLWLAAIVAAAVGCLSVGVSVAHQMPPLMMAGVPAMLASVVLAFVLLFRTRNAYFRNCFALGSFTLGVLLLICGGLITNLLGLTAGLTLLLPASLLLVTGLAGIFLHTAESLYLGGKTTAKAGLAFSVVVLGVLVLMSMVRQVEAATMVILILLPAGIVVIGALGMLLNGRLLRRRTELLLTDNRARLLTLTLGGLFSIFGLFAAAPTGVEFFPDTDPTLVNISLQAPLGTNIDETNRVTSEAQQRVNALLDGNSNDRSNVKNILVNVGTGGDAMFGGGAPGSENSILTLNMVDYADRPESSRNTMTRLRERLQGLPGISMDFEKDNPGPPVGAPVNIEISGESFDEIARITAAIKGGCWKLPAPAPSRDWSTSMTT